MSDILVRDIGSAINIDNIVQKNSPSQKVTGSTFDDVISEAISRVSQLKNDADKAVEELVKGGDITSAILAIEKADISLQLMVEIRNRLISTYEEIMKMPI